MKQPHLGFLSGDGRAARSLFHCALPILVAGFIAASLPLAGRAQPSRYEAEGEEVQTRGPVHEAFAAVVSYNPEPGIVVRTRPPELIEELPPEERPDGDDVAWIPGYWAWDDERNDFLWISGTWRILPPGREWFAGYWRESAGGYQWISGYWADSTEQETVYLPPPPATLEVGANIDPQSIDYGWSPGCWVWRGDRYVWRAGYWAEGRADWVWVPSYYVWTPRGVIFVEGFWDYPVERRGILFAPVYYRSHEYSRRGYSYSPRIAINLTLFLDNLFLRPSYHHYYFGDYYGSRYEQGGFYASVSYQSSRRGYDPFYSYDRWSHRSDRDWDSRFQAAYRYRRDNEAARPPRTWSAQVSISARVQIGGTARIQLAVPLEQLVRSPDTTIRLRAVAQDDRQQLAQRGREVQVTREQRRTVEAAAAATIGRNAPATAEPVRVAAPRSSIAARRPQADAPARPQNADRRNPPAEPRRAEPDRGRPPENRPAARRENEPQASREIAAPDADRRNRDAEVKADADQARQRANDTAVRNQQQAAERQAAAEAKARDEAQRNAREESQQKTRQDAERRGRDAQEKARVDEDSRRQSEERANAAARQNREEAQRKANDAQQKANESAAREKQQAEERRNAAEAKARDEAQQVRQDAERRNRDVEEKSRAVEKSRQQNEERANEADRNAREDAKQKENDDAARAQQEAERANAAAAKAREDQQRGKQPPPAVRPPRDEPKGKPAPKPKTPEEEEADNKEKEKRGRG